MTRAVALCAVLTAACLGGSHRPGIDASAARPGAGVLPSLVHGALDAGDGAGAGDAGAVVAPDAGADTGAGDAGAVVAPDAGVGAGDASAGLPGVRDGGSPYDAGQGVPFNAWAGCLPGYLNCDGSAATGCEVMVGCPAADGMRCASCRGSSLCWCRGQVAFTTGNCALCPAP